MGVTVCVLGGGCRRMVLSQCTKIVQALALNKWVSLRKGNRDRKEQGNGVEETGEEERGKYRDFSTQGMESIWILIQANGLKNKKVITETVIEI